MSHLTHASVRTYRDDCDRKQHANAEQTIMYVFINPFKWEYFGIICMHCQPFSVHNVVQCRHLNNCETVGLFCVTWFMCMAHIPNTLSTSFALYTSLAYYKLFTSKLHLFYSFTCVSHINWMVCMVATEFVCFNKKKMLINSTFFIFYVPLIPTGTHIRFRFLGAAVDF